VNIHVIIETGEQLGRERCDLLHRRERQRCVRREEQGDRFGCVLKGLDAFIIQTGHAGHERFFVRGGELGEFGRRLGQREIDHHIADRDDFFGLGGKDRAFIFFQPGFDLPVGTTSKHAFVARRNFLGDQLPHPAANAENADFDHNPYPAALFENLLTGIMPSNSIERKRRKPMNDILSKEPERKLPKVKAEDRHFYEVEFFLLSPPEGRGRYDVKCVTTSHDNLVWVVYDRAAGEEGPEQISLGIKGESKGLARFSLPADHPAVDRNPRDAGILRELTDGMVEFTMGQLAFMHDADRYLRKPTASFATKTTPQLLEWREVLSILASGARQLRAAVSSVARMPAPREP
jgi:hypothetical protein